MWVLSVVLFAGVLVEPFRIGEAGPGYQQVATRVDMAQDGRLVVAWIDSTGTKDNYKLWVRFFSRNCAPSTDAIKIKKIKDSFCMSSSELDMDSEGNSVLLWSESPTHLSNDNYLRFQVFDKDGTPLDTPQAIYRGYLTKTKPLGVSCNNQNQFAVVWNGAVGDGRSNYVYIRRYDFTGNPLCEPFIAHDSAWIEGSLMYPQVALNDSGDIVVTWLKFVQTGQMYARFQVFDKNNKPVFDWAPEGHQVEEVGPTGQDASRSEPHWLDNDRFVIFWFDGNMGIARLKGTVFSEKGLSRHSVKQLVFDENDSTIIMWGSYRGDYSTYIDGEHFVAAFDRAHKMFKDTNLIMWQHQAGVLGEFLDNEPWRSTAIFEISPPFGADTICDADPQPPAVACNADRIVWVYSRMEPDTTWKAYALVTDWNMGVGITEPSSPVTHQPSSELEIVSPIGQSVTLRYSNFTNGFRAQVFDASGRKVDELHSPQTQGTIRWPVTPVTPVTHQGFVQEKCGVYFIVPEGASAKPVKAVIVK